MSLWCSPFVKVLVIRSLWCSPSDRTGPPEQIRSQCPYMISQRISQKFSVKHAPTCKVYVSPTSWIHTISGYWVSTWLATEWLHVFILCVYRLNIHEFRIHPAIPLLDLFVISTSYNIWYYHVSVFQLNVMSTNISPIASVNTWFPSCLFTQIVSSP